MLTEYNVHLPLKVNSKIRNWMEKYDIANHINVIREGQFDVFTVGYDGIPHIRLANVLGKWTCSVIDPHRLDDGGDVLERFTE